MIARAHQLLQRPLSRRGLEVRRHPAWRRQAMIARHRVDVVLDVGAAVGGYGQELRRFGYTGRIVSFEPMAASFAGLERAAADDPDWSLHRVALGDEAGRATLHVASNADSSSLLPMLERHRDAAPTIDYVAEEEVEVARLDDLDVLGDDARALLKIDAQGFERTVLAGARDTIARCVGVQLELSFVPLYDGGMLVDEAVSTMYAAGFRLVGFEQGFADASRQVLQADGVFFRTDA